MKARISKKAQLKQHRGHFLTLKKWDKLTLDEAYLNHRCSAEKSIDKRKSYLYNQSHGNCRDNNMAVWEGTTW